MGLESLAAAAIPTVMSLFSSLMPGAAGAAGAGAAGAAGSAASAAAPAIAWEFGKEIPLAALLAPPGQNMTMPAQTPTAPGGGFFGDLGKDLLKTGLTSMMQPKQPGMPAQPPQIPQSSSAPPIAFSPPPPMGNDAMLMQKLMRL